MADDTIKTQTADDELLGKFIKQFDDAADSTDAYRQEAESARDYYDGEQWTPQERDTLKKRKQPCITDNRIADKVQYLMGLERKTRTDPKAYPRTPADEQAAEASTDAIRYVFDCNDFHQIRSLVFENMMVEGVGAAEVVREGGKDKIRRIRWDRLYFDPHSMQLDFSDAQYLGIVAWMDETRLRQRYPDKVDLIEGTFSEAVRTGTDTYDDTPKLRWVDVKRRRLQVFEHYYWDRVWKRAVFIKGGFLEPPRESAYRDEDNQPEHPIIAQAAFRDRDGNPYGVVRRYKSLQDEVNKRRSKALHALNTRRVKAEKGAVDNVEKARAEVQRPDGWVEYKPGMALEIESNTDIGMSQFNLLQDALTALSMTGPNAAMTGTSGDISGRAKQVDAEGGAIQVGPLFDQVRHFQKRVARMVWNRIRQFWTEETWVRVTDDERKVKFVGLNVATTRGELEAERMKTMGLAPQEMQARLMQLAMDPMSRMPARKNAVAAMHVDIIIEEAPDTITLQQEQFAELVNLARANVVFPPEVYVEASGLRNKQRLLEIMKGGGEPTPEQQAEQEKVRQLAEIAAQTELRQKVAEADKTEAEAQQTVVETAAMIHNAARPEPPADNPAGDAR